MSRIYLAYRSKKQRFCAVQAFCAAKPWRRANSLRPSILISHRNPKKEVTTYVVTSFLGAGDKRPTGAFSRFARALFDPLPASFPKNKGMTYIMPLFFVVCRQKRCRRQSLVPQWVCGYNPFLTRQTAEHPSHGGYSAVHLLIHRFPAQSPFCCPGTGCGWFPRPPP